MLKKILTREYLKGYSDMTNEERKSFDGRVGEWLTKHGTRLVTLTNRPMAKSQNLITLTARWTAEDCHAVEEGILLMSALVKVSDTWLPSQLYVRSAFRSVRQMVGVLMGSAKGKVNGLNLLVDPATGAPTTKTDVTVTGQPKKPLPTIKTVSRVYDAATDTVRVQCEVVPAHQPSAISHQPSSGLVPARPRHIDQYVHLLPKETQERAAQYGPLMREMEEARENLRLLMNDSHSSSRDLESWAKKVTAIDKKIAGIKRELDAEWEKLVNSGRVVVDDLGNARVVSNEELRMKNEEFLAVQATKGRAATAQPSSINPQTSCVPMVASEQNSSASVTPPIGENEKGPLSSEQKARRRELRKWLTDTRRGNGATREEHLIKWKENFKEYLTLEQKEKALADQKILEAMEHYGIDN